MQHRPLWWLHPAWTVGGFTGLVVIAAHVISEKTYLENWHTPKYLDDTSLWLLLLCVASFVAGSLLVDLPARRRLGIAIAQEPPVDYHLLRKLLRVSYALTLFGYAVWSAAAILRGLNLSVVMAILRGQSGVAYTIREQYLGNISGVTTCTQFGIAMVILAALSRIKPTRRQFLLLILPLAVLTILRVLLNSERLALNELIVPAAVVFVDSLNRSTSSRSVRRLLRVLPVAGFGMLFAGFSVFEYFRSWVTFYSSGNQSFLEFAASRLLGYYVTALNNGACLYRFLPQPLHMPYYTLGFLWEAPVVKGLMQAWFPNSFSVADYYGLLARAANPEFNNSGGLLLPVFDLGILAGLLYWLLAGIVCGLLYRFFRAGNAWGMCLYPFVYITLLEIPRGVHWCNTRAFPGFCFLLTAALLLRIQQTRLPLRQLQTDSDVDRASLYQQTTT